MTDSDDAQRVADEIHRCEEVIRTARRHDDDGGLSSTYAYYQARAFLLRGATTVDAIRFLREETLDALKGGMSPEPAATAKTDRWLRLQELDYLNKRRIREMNRRMRRTVDINRAGLAAIDAAPGSA